MARQHIDTTPPTGDPAPTAFNKINAMTAELYPLATGAMARVNPAGTGDFYQAGRIRSQPNGGDQIFMREASATGVTIDAVNASNSAFTILNLRGSAVNITGDSNVSGNFRASSVSTASAIVSDAYGIVSQGPGSGYQMVDRQDYGQTWAWFASGALLSCWNSVNGGVMSVSRAGVVTAAQFSPVSSAEVKDYIEGYTGDADAELDRMVVIEYKYRPEFIQSEKRFVGLLAENVADVHGSASDPEQEVWTQVEVERLVDVEYPVEVVRQVTVLTPVEGFDPDKPEYIRTTESVLDIVMETRQEMRRVMEGKKTTKPRSVDMMQILALSVRAHQQKSRRIRDLEAALGDAVAGLAGAVARIEALEAAS